MAEVKQLWDGRGSLPFEIADSTTRLQFDAWAAMAAASPAEKPLRESWVMARLSRNMAHEAGLNYHPRSDEETAESACNIQRAGTINLALIAADALGRAGVGGQVEVVDIYAKLAEPAKVPATSSYSKGLRQRVVDFIHGTVQFAELEVSDDKKCVLLSGWVVDTRRYRDVFHDFHTRQALILSNSAGPGQLVVATVEAPKKRSQYDAADAALTYLGNRNRMHVLPDPYDLSRASRTYGGLTLEASDQLYHMYSREPMRHYWNDSCVPWHWSTTKEATFSRYLNAGVESAVQLGLINLLIEHGLTPQSTYGYAGR